MFDNVCKLGHRIETPVSRTFVGWLILSAASCNDSTVRTILFCHLWSLFSTIFVFFSLSRTGSKLITPDDPVFKEGRSSAIRVGCKKSLWNLRNGYKKEKSRQNGAPRAWRTLRAVSQIGTLQIFFNYYRWEKRYWEKKDRWKK